MIRHRTFVQRKSDLGVATMLSLLYVSRCGNRIEIEAYEWELTSRAAQGAKMGDG